MSKKYSETPPLLKPYAFHGLDFNFGNGDKEAVADCPFCGKEEKFTVDINSGMWRCFSCNTGSEKGGGNQFTFFRCLLENSIEYTTQEDLKKIANEKGIKNLSLLRKWNLVKNFVTDDWIFPAYSINEDKELKIVQVYKYTKSKDKFRFFATPETKQALFGLQFLKSGVKTIFLVEGIWDAIVLNEVLLAAKKSSEIIVLAVPGCNTFNEDWCKYFSKKIVNICFDNDHPRTNPKTNMSIPPAAFSGLKRTVKILLESKKQPKEINYLKWGEDGYDDSLLDGMDIRDLLNNASN